MKKVVDETLPKRPDVLSQENEKASGDQKNMAGGKKDAEVKNQEKQTKPETEEEHQVEVELGSILKRSPSTCSTLMIVLRSEPRWCESLTIDLLIVIIFSKSYCPYSKKAKSIFERYSIVPAPFVVELDEHPLGRQLQEELHRTTGRRTVPNILISGRSIGGGDDVAALHSQGELMNKVRSMGGKRIMEAKLKEGG